MLSNCCMWIVNDMSNVRVEEIWSKCVTHHTMLKEIWNHLHSYRELQKKCPVVCCDDGRRQKRDKIDSLISYHLFDDVPVLNTQNTKLFSGIFVHQTTANPLFRSENSHTFIRYFFFQQRYCWRCWWCCCAVSRAGLRFWDFCYNFIPQTRRHEHTKSE